VETDDKSIRWKIQLAESEIKNLKAIPGWHRKRSIGRKIFDLQNSIKLLRGEKPAPL